MRLPSPATRLAEIAIRLPGARRVLRDHGIDYATGGQRTLAEACRERGASPEDLLALIAARAGSEAEGWAELPLATLADFIVTRYHREARVLLPQVCARARAADPELGRLAEGLRDATLRHMEKEERILFPMLVSGAGHQAAGPVHGMEQEHREHVHALALLRAAAATLPPSPAAAALRARLETLAAHALDHVHFENNVLFPRAICEFL